MTLSSFLCREKHEKSLINDIMSILTHIIDEEASEQLLEVILRNLLKEEKVSADGVKVHQFVFSAQ